MLILSVPILLLTWKMGGVKQKVPSSKLFIRSRYEYLEIKAEMLISCLIFIFFFFCYQQFILFFFIFSQTTQHNIQNKTKQNSRHILNISKFNQKGGREGRTTRTQKFSYSSFDVKPKCFQITAKIKGIGLTVPILLEGSVYDNKCLSSGHTYNKIWKVIKLHICHVWYAWSLIIS